MNEIKIPDEEAKKAADAVYYFGSKCYAKGVTNTVLCTVGIVTGVGLLHGIIFAIKAIIKKRSEKKANETK